MEKPPFHFWRVEEGSCLNNNSIIGRGCFWLRNFHCGDQNAFLIQMSSEGEAISQRILFPKYFLPQTSPLTIRVSFSASSSLHASVCPAH